MQRIDVLNAVALCAALALAMAGGGLGAAHMARPRAVTATPQVATERLADGGLALRDAAGVLVPLRAYARIASASLVADRVLADLCEPQRVVAYTRYARETPQGHRYAGKPALAARSDPEHVIALQPDLLITSDMVAASFAARLREHGVQVFTLGPMRGLSTLLPAIHAIGQLIGQPERAGRYADTLARRLRAVAAALPKDTPRPRALYLSSYGDRLFAAGADTSYHDAITYAGLRDAAAEQDLAGWPQLTAEQVLTLDPDVLITRTGMSAVLCRHPGLAQLRGCSDAGRSIELDGALLDDPGPGLLEATEAIHGAFWTP
jgi:iron complex transport system substrate-binding protein